jgi:hypothetical protein
VEFVTRWPTLLTAQRARRETLVAFFHEHNVRRAATVERRLEAIKTEKPLTTDRAVIEPAVLHVQALLAQLRELNRSIAHFDEEIAQRSAKLADFKLFAALPGAGPSLAPRLLVAFGERRERFPNAAAVQKLASHR